MTSGLSVVSDFVLLVVTHEMVHAPDVALR